MTLVLVLNTLVVCYIIEISTSYFIYNRRQASYQLGQNMELHNSVSYTDNENSMSYNEVHIYSLEKFHRHDHKHIRRTHDKHYIRSESICHCDDCGSEGNEDCDEFCEESCPQYNSYPVNQVTPEVIAVPYPVPVMIVTANNINKNINTLKTNATNVPPVKSSVSDITTTAEPKINVTDVPPTRSSESDKTNIKELTPDSNKAWSYSSSVENITNLIPNDKVPRKSNNVPKHYLGYGNTLKANIQITFKRRKVIPINKNIFFPFTTTPNNRFLTYRIVVPRKQINLRRQIKLHG